MSEIAPTVPGSTRPGFQSSTRIPTTPSESISAMMFGSISVSSVRCQNDISTVSTLALRPCASVRPFGFVTVPSISLSSAGSVGETTSTMFFAAASRAP